PSAGHALPMSVSAIILIPLFFFFQAEDGIRDGHVTGVQTCALPILAAEIEQRGRAGLDRAVLFQRLRRPGGPAELHGSRERADRSEERRVGKECRSRWSPDH